MTQGLMNIQFMYSEQTPAVKGDEEQLIPGVCQCNSLTFAVVFSLKRVDDGAAFRKEPILCICAML